jgi:hypothetical protein
MKAMIEVHTNLAAMIDRFRDAVYPASTARAI